MSGADNSESEISAESSQTGYDRKYILGYSRGVAAGGVYYGYAVVSAVSDTLSRQAALRRSVCVYA